MKIKSVLLVLLLGLFSIVASAQSVVVTSKKVVYKRSKPNADYKKTFTITYPKVKAATPALAKKIESAIGFEKNLGFTLKEEISGDVQWLEEADYEIKYNKNGILTVNLFITGTGAYPSSTNKTIVVDLKTGNKILPANVFTNINGLIARIKQIQQEKIKSGVEEVKSDPSYTELQSEIEEQLKNADFKAANLEGFSVENDGVTFFYDYGFPHAIEALEPSGDYFLSWAEIKPFVKRTGLLGKFVR
jgi:hypothetical protein